MHLNREQIRQMENALLSAFPTHDELNRLVRLGLDWSLEAITHAGNLTADVFNLITYAESRGQIADLLGAAHDMNPGNPELNELTRTINLIPGSLPGATSPPAPLRVSPDQFQDITISSVAQQLAGKQSDPAFGQLFLRLLPNLYDNRLTYNEPLDECLNQNWRVRLHKAGQTLRFLQTYRTNLNLAKGITEEQQQLYGQLILETRRYSEAMAYNLFKPPVVIEDIENYIGNTDFVEQLKRMGKEPVVFPDSSEHDKLAIPAEILRPCEQHRETSLKLFQALYGTLSAASPGS
jgi:hypothetical protein